ncbi:MAG: flagellar motor switch protein FliG, partial [Granulosicoccaceae bacterium]
KALGGFVEDVREQTSFGIDNSNYLEGLLGDALGEDKARSLIERIDMQGEPASVEALKRMSANGVLEVVRDEHPQIIAVVLSMLEGKVAGEVMKALSEETHVDVLMRIARLNTLAPSAMRELDVVLESRLRKQQPSTGSSESVGGEQVAATLINNVGPDLGDVLKDKLREEDEALATRVAALMFVFEDLLGVDDRGIQTLLRDVSTDDLVIGLKGASPEMNDKILSNMSSRAAELLKDDMDARGPVRLADVEEAQKRVCDIAKNLEAEGKLMIGGGDDFV